MAFYQGAALALKLGAPIQVRLDPILHYWVGLTFPVMELPKHVEIVYCVHMSKNNYVQLYEIGCPWRIRTSTKGIKNPYAAITSRDILKLGVDVGFAPTVSWGFGEFLVRTNARREPIVNWDRPCNPIQVQLANPRVTWLTTW